MNNVVLIGRLTRDPELRYIPGSGTAVARFSIAVDRGLSREKKKEAESKNQPTADFFNIVVWGKTAENCANYLVKGRLVGIQGRIQNRTYEDGGVRKYMTEIITTNVEFLEWGDTNRSQGSQGSQGFGDSSFDFGGIEGFHPTDNDDIPF